MSAILIHGGTVVDPLARREALADLLLDGGRVVAVGPGLALPRGAQRFDAGGSLVLPGLVDTHVHVGDHRYEGHAMMARVGVTTALNLSGRMREVLDGIKSHGAGLTIASLDSVVPSEVEGGERASSGALAEAIDRSLESGAFGIKILGGHQPFQPEPTGEIIRLANERRAYVAFHVGTTEHGSNLRGLRQAVELAGDRALHVAHVNSYTRGQLLDALVEAQEAIQLLVQHPNLRSESYLARLNGTSARCRDGAPVSAVTRTCLGLRGYPPTEVGMEQAILGGWAQVADSNGDEIGLLAPEQGRDLFREMGTNVGICFEVNDSVSQIVLAAARRPDGRFAVDALSTDGGGIPRNLTVELGLSLVQLGVLSLADFVRKACLAPARMLGLEQKGHLGVGADGDVAIVHPSTRRVRATFAAGEPIMVDGVVLGSGGRVVTTPRGERAVRAAGLPVEVVDPARCGLYRRELVEAANV
jgi:cytosine/adenosine deaminase-related metal-dependent hydrolase